MARRQRRDRPSRMNRCLRLCGGTTAATATERLILRAADPRSRALQKVLRSDLLWPRRVPSRTTPPEMQRVEPGKPPSSKSRIDLSFQGVDDSHRNDLHDRTDRDTPSRSPQYQCLMCQIARMPNRVSQGGGRPSKGERVRMLSRVPTPVAEAVRAEAERLNLGWSDVIANALADRYGLPQVAVPETNDQMRLTA